MLNLQEWKDALRDAPLQVWLDAIKDIRGESASNLLSIGLNFNAMRHILQINQVEHLSAVVEELLGAEEFLHMLEALI